MKPLRILIILITLISFGHEGFCQNIISNKDVARRYIEEAVNNRNLDLIDEIFADSFLVHILVDSTESLSNRKSLKDFLLYLFKAFPDIHYKVGDIIEEGDKVVMRVSFNGTHKDEFWGHQGSGNRVNYLSEIFFFRFKNGKIVEDWVQVDLYNLFKKLKGEK